MADFASTYTAPISTPSNGVQQSWDYNSSTVETTSENLYLMRGKIISTSAIIYWDSEGVPDPTGIRSGHFGDITNVTTIRSPY
jgi:hypothetical protein